MLETIEPGLLASLAVRMIAGWGGIDNGVRPTAGLCEIKDAESDCVSSWDSSDTVWHVHLRSSIDIRVGAAEVWSRVLSLVPSAAAISASGTPRARSMARSLRFSSRTFLAAL